MRTSGTSSSGNDGPPNICSYLSIDAPQQRWVLVRSGESRQLESKDLPLAGAFYKAPRYRSQLPPAQDRGARGSGSRSPRPVPKKETIAKAAHSAPHHDVRAPVMSKTAPLPPPEHLINAKILEKNLSYQKLLKKAPRPTTILELHAPLLSPPRTNSYYNRTNSPHFGPCRPMRRSSLKNKKMKTKKSS
ncbi:unnamed protein product [Polarella glacialis]|uniref:Uncharacterized protein n=1 Tax=Polarella glacialis TaxID=89957 RepID=A0A813L4W7_POLGL|nr:unnamed protein product [Polarella glacialis]